MFVLWWWVLHVIGADNASGPWYLWWSGFFGDTTIFAALFLLYWHRTCDVGFCFRLHRYKTAAGHNVCRHHHPDMPNQAPSAQDVVDAHNAAVDAAAGADDGE